MKIADVMQRGMHDYHQLSQREKGMFHSRLAGIFNHVDLARRLVESGLLSADIAESKIHTLIALVKTKGAGMWWQDIGHTFGIHDYLEQRRLEKSNDIAQFNTLSSWRVE